MGRKKLAQKMFEQHQEQLRLKRLKEQENSASTEAKRAYNRPVYPGLFSKPGRCGNDLGERMKKVILAAGVTIFGAIFVFLYKVGEDIHAMHRCGCGR